MTALDFTACRSRLRPLRCPTFAEAESDLLACSGRLQLLASAAELGVARPPDLSLAGEPDPQRLHDLTAAVLTALGRLIPLNEWWTEVLLQEDALPPAYVPIQLCNLVTNWDEWDELVANPETLEPDLALLTFVYWLDRIQDDETWATAAAHFGWPFAGLPDGLLAPPNGWVLDAPHFLAALEAAGLGAFRAAFEIGWFDTGTPFFDLDDDLLERGAAPAFTLTSIRDLIAAWQTARALSDQERAARELVARDPTLYLRLAELYCQALSERRQP